MSVYVKINNCLKVRQVCNIINNNWNDDTLRAKIY